MMTSIHASLKRLKTDYIDLYWVHIWDPLTPIEETMRGLDDLISQGKINYIGISDAPAWVVSRANTLAELRGWTQFVGLQVEYSLIERTCDRELLPMAREMDLAVTVWSPLAGGLLTGKYQDGIPSDSRGALPGYEWLSEQLKDPRALDKVGRLLPIADMTAGFPVLFATAGPQ